MSRADARTRKPSGSFRRFLASSRHSETDPVSVVGVCATRSGVLINAFLIGFAAGLLVGVLLGQRRSGCFVLTTVPIAAIAYICWWQGQHPELIRSTSGLDFVFGPIPPSIGALIGYGFVWLIRDWRDTRP